MGISWEVGTLGKPYYFFYYYVPKRYSYLVSQESLRIQRGIWSFKDGQILQCGAQDLIIGPLEKKLTSTFESFNDIVFVCLPASTRRTNEIRYKNFSRRICEVTGMINGFDQIRIVKEKEPSHLGNVGKAEYEFNKQFFNKKHVVLFDDVVTRGRSMRDMIESLQEAGAVVDRCISIGRTYSTYLGDRNVYHPWSQTDIFDGHSQVTLMEKELPMAQTPSIVLPVTVSTVVDSCHESKITAIPVRAKEIKEARPDTILRFGRFAGKPLEWIVLAQDGEQVMAITRRGILSKAYHEEHYYTTWEECSLRYWLNHEFINQNFNETEQARIKEHLVRAEVNEYHELNPGSDTMDKAFLLSFSEYKRYFLDENRPFDCRMMNGELRQCWVRDYGVDRMHASFIGRSGSIHSGGSWVDSSRNAVRPVMWFTVG